MRQCHDYTSRKALESRKPCRTSAAERPILCHCPHLKELSLILLRYKAAPSQSPCHPDHGNFISAGDQRCIEGSRAGAAAHSQHASGGRWGRGWDHRAAALHIQGASTRPVCHARLHRTPQRPRAAAGDHRVSFEKRQQVQDASQSSLLTTAFS
jgi:hypothetical protein